MTYTNILSNLNTMIQEAEAAVLKSPTDAVANGHFARVRKLKFAREIIMEMERKKFGP